MSVLDIFTHVILLNLQDNLKVSFIILISQMIKQMQNKFSKLLVQYHTANEKEMEIHQNQTIMPQTCSSYHTTSPIQLAKGIQRYISNLLILFLRILLANEINKESKTRALVSFGVKLLRRIGSLSLTKKPKC